MEITEICCNVTLLWQKFRESNVFAKENNKELIDEMFFGDSKFFIFHIAMWIRHTHSELLISLNFLQKWWQKYSVTKFITRTLFPQILSHTFLTKISSKQQLYKTSYLLKSWFHEIFFLWSRISRFPILCLIHLTNISWNQLTTFSKLISPFDFT